MYQYATLNKMKWNRASKVSRTSSEAGVEVDSLVTWTSMKLKLDFGFYFKRELHRNRDLTITTDVCIIIGTWVTCHYRYLHIIKRLRSLDSFANQQGSISSFFENDFFKAMENGQISGTDLTNVFSLLCFLSKKKQE